MHLNFDVKNAFFAKTLCQINTLPLRNTSCALPQSTSTGHFESCLPWGKKNWFYRHVSTWCAYWTSAPHEWSPLLAANRSMARLSAKAKTTESLEGGDRNLRPPSAQKSRLVFGGIRWCYLQVRLDHVTSPNGENWGSKKKKTVYHDNPQERNTMTGGKNGITHYMHYIECDLIINKKCDASICQSFMTTTTLRHSNKHIAKNNQMEI